MLDSDGRLYRLGRCPEFEQLGLEVFGIVLIPSRPMLGGLFQFFARAFGYSS